MKTRIIRRVCFIMGLGVRSESHSHSSILPSFHFHLTAESLTFPSSSSTMLTIFGGIVSDLRPMLTEERFPDGWEPRVRSRYGLTMAAFNATVIPVELGVRKARKAQ